MNNVMETIYRNVKALAAINGLKLMDVEKDAGLSVGYLSRCKSLDVNALVELARMLDVGVEELISCDFTEELTRKEILCDLKAAVLRAKKHFTEAGILQFVENACREAEPEEATEE